MSQGTDMMLMSETRQQNTEVRLTLSKMSDKVDQVLQKVRQILLVKCLGILMFGRYGKFLIQPIKNCRIIHFVDKTKVFY